MAVVLAADRPGGNATAGRSSVVARNGMVATSQPLAAQAGLLILRQGGNAIDAAVATASALAVVEPMMVGLGGDMFALLYIGRTRELVGINASGFSPLAVDTDRATWASFDETMAAYEKGGYTGMGFVISADDPFAFVDPGETVSVTSDCLVGGLYYMFVAPLFNPPFECGAEYRATVTCEECTGACCFIDGSCAVVMENKCVLPIGLYQGDGTDCAGADCFAGCGFPSQGSCCTTTGSPGCDDLDCCEAVCNIDPFCCDVAWDTLCAAVSAPLFPDECDCLP